MVLFTAVLLSLARPALAGEPDTKAPSWVSKELSGCLAVAKETPGEESSIGPDPTYNSLTALNLGPRDSATLACFYKYAQFESYDYQRCFEVAGTLPTPYARHVASEACFNAWAKKGTASQCHQVLERKPNWTSIEAKAYLGELYLYSSVKNFLNPSSPPLLVTEPLLIHEKVELLRKSCDELKTAEVIRKIQGGYEITRLVPNRPLTDAEKRVCAIEASVMGTNYELSRAHRAAAAAPLLAQFRRLLAGIPEKVREAISIGEGSAAEALLRNYAKRLPRSSLASIDIGKRAIIYGFSSKSYDFRGEIPLHTTLALDEAQIGRDVLDPPGGWALYYKKESLMGCPPVTLKTEETPVPEVAISTQGSKKDLEAFELKMETCNPTQENCRGLAGSAK